MPDTEKKLVALLDGCRNQDRQCQLQLYEHFYGYSLSICLRYAHERMEAVEILNDAFLKIFTRIDRFDAGLPFKPWLRHILIFTAIDHYRSRNLRPIHVDLSAAADLASEDLSIPILSPDEDALPYIQQLSPTYRMVFNLYVMEEYSHHEIAEMLGINEATSRSNLARAKEKLRQMLSHKNERRAKHKTSNQN